MEFKNVVNNGVQILNECTCIWCGSKMHRSGANRMGAARWLSCLQIHLFS